MQTHKNNIGACANIMRALELSESIYTWVLCDDDVLELSKMDDVLEVIGKEEIDLIHVGAHPEREWSYGGKLDYIKSLFNDGYPYFKYGSFLPCNIIKTNSFQNNFLIPGYNNIVNGYPHMPFLQNIFQENKLIYISKNRIVSARTTGQSYDTNTWMIWWINTSKLMKLNEDVNLMFFSHWEQKTTAISDLIQVMKINNAYKKEILKFVDDFLKKPDRKAFKQLLFKGWIKIKVIRVVKFIYGRIFK